MQVNSGGLTISVGNLTGIGDASEVSLQAFIDHSSVEFSINAGETVMSAQVFPTQPNSSVQLSSDGQVEVESADLYRLESIWGNK